MDKFRVTAGKEDCLGNVATWHIVRIEDEIVWKSFVGDLYSEHMPPYRAKMFAQVECDRLNRGDIY